MAVTNRDAGVIDFSGRTTLPDLLNLWAERRAQQPFLIWSPLEGQSITYSWAEMAKLAGWADRFLAGHGISARDHFCVHMKNRPETLALLIAAAARGAVIIPTNTRLTGPELRYLISHSRSQLVVTEPELAQTVARAVKSDPVKVVELSENVSDSLHMGAPLLENHKRDNNADVAVLYTSGTTAHPKGVRLSQAALIHAGHAIAAGIGFTPLDRNLAVLPLFHINSLCYTVMTAMVTGGSLALNDRFSATRFFEQANKTGATFGWLAATPLRMLLARAPAGKPSAGSLRKIVFGQNLTEGEFREWNRRFGVPLQQIYGMTETVMLPLMSTDLHAHQPSAIGRATSGVTARLITENGKDAASGEAGELWLRLRPVRQMMSGYLFDAAATEKTFENGWFKTGDIMQADNAGLFYFIDRRRDVLKVSGENVSASEVEMVLNSHPAIFDSAVVGKQNPLRDQEVKAFVIFQAGAACTPTQLIDWCHGRLAKFKVPVEVTICQDFPRTSAGKIQKTLLEDREGG